jgi:transcriptional regulator with XRE-family HTH domain
MLDKPRLQQLLVSFLARWYDVSQKVMASRTGLTEPGVSKYLRNRERNDEVFASLLGVVLKRPAAEPAVTACLESLDALDQIEDVTEEELAAIEEEARRAARLTREILTEAIRRSRPGQAGGDPQAEISELCLLLCAESERAAARQTEVAVVLAQVAVDLAARLPEAEGQWLRGYAAAQEAHVLRDAGEPAAEGRALRLTAS